MELIVTDLDGTLLDRDTYSFAEVKPALELIERRKAPLVLCTSKTRAEVEFWRRSLDNSDPFIVENGGALFVPGKAQAGLAAAATLRGGYSEGYFVWEFGTPYSNLVATLREVSRESHCPVRGFYDMTIKEVADQCQMAPDEAALAKEREYDEPFVILTPDRAQYLLAAIEERGLHWTRGDRFCHITGSSDKGKAVRVLIELYSQAAPRLFTIGLGDGLNDAAFLNVVDVAILIRSPFIYQLMARVPRGVVTESSGPKGWNDAVLRILADQLHERPGTSSRQARQGT